MKLTQEFFNEIEKYKSYVIIVEGKKDLTSLQALGFSKVYVIHKISVPIKERILTIAQQITKKEKVCILTDFDKKGKALYFLLKSLFQEQGVKLDSSLRGLLLKAKVSHVEGLYHLLKNNIL